MTPEQLDVYNNDEVNEKIKKCITKVNTSDVIDDIFDKIAEELAPHFTRVESNSETVMAYKVDRRKNEESVNRCIDEALESINHLLPNVDKEYVVDVKRGSNYIEIRKK